MKTYIAIAYRYGWSNNDWHIVSAGADLDAVDTAARLEPYERGGKYGVEVLEFPGEKRLAYYPSAYGEASPRFNERIYASSSIGGDVIDAVDGGFAMLPDQDDSRYLVPTTAELPQWLRDRAAHHLEIAKIIAGGINSPVPEPRKE